MYTQVPPAIHARETLPSKRARRRARETEARAISSPKKEIQELNDLMGCLSKAPNTLMTAITELGGKHITPAKVQHHVNTIAKTVASVVKPSNDALKKKGYDFMNIFDEGINTFKTMLEKAPTTGGTTILSNGGGNTRKKNRGKTKRKKSKRKKSKRKKVKR